MIEPLERRLFLSVEPLDAAYGAAGVQDLPFGTTKTYDRGSAVAVAADGKVVVAGRTGEGGAIALVR